MRNNTIVLATRNKGKIVEFGALLAPFDLTVLGFEAFADLPEIEETGATFAENALLKARAVCRLTGRVAVADDSGLEVDALGKAPGVYSARYSATPDEEATDDRNIMKLLHELASVPDEKRSGRFRCCMAACAPNGDSITAEGAWEGRILRERRGENGFGYDPLFFDPQMDRSAAQMSREEKNSRSHRAKATQKLLALWPEFWKNNAPALRKVVTERD